MATRKKTSSQRKQEIEKADTIRKEVVLWIIVAVAILLFISNIGFGGAVGGAVAGFFFGIFGMLNYLFPVLLLVGTFFAVSNKNNAFAVIKLIAGILFVIFLCTFLYLTLYGAQAPTPIEAYKDSSQRHLGGGIIGGLIGYMIVPGFGMIGAYVLDIILMIVCLVLITGKSAMKGMKNGSKKVYDSAKETSERRAETREARRMDKKVRGVSLDTKIEGKSSSIKTDEMGEIHIENYPESLIPEDQMPEVKAETHVKLESGVHASTPMQELFTPETAVSQPVVEPVYEPPIEEPPVAERTKRRAKSSEAEIKAGVAEVASSISASETKSSSNYNKPSIEILHKGESSAVGNTAAQLEETKKKLVETLGIFGVKATISQATCGPSVTRYEVLPELGTKVSKIVNLADDIKFALAATDVRIEAPIPGKSAVGIEVPNAKNVAVPFRDIVESYEFKMAKSSLAIGLGKDITGKVIVTDLAKLPHLMIAGSTGSGKSVCINTIITSILYNAGPDEVKLIMIDPKVVELSVYNGIPHLLIPVVTDPNKAANALNWAVAEMMDRYQKFAEVGVRGIDGYNEKIEKIEIPNEEERPPKMSRIVVIVDELADLMMVAAKDVEEAIARLSQLARAAGIHLIIATQRPSADVITGIIRSNIASRIAFAVANAMDSRIILDQPGADRLLGKGDMLFNPQGATHPTRVQGAFIMDSEIQEIIDDVIAKNGESKVNEEIEKKMASMPKASNSVSISDGEYDDGRDSYFEEAARIVVDKEKASIGMLQRYLKIGFNRAARIMDQLEEAGVVGPDLGTKPRTVLMGPEGLVNILEDNYED